MSGAVTDPTGKGTPTGTVSFIDETDNMTICSGLVPSGPQNSVSCVFTPTLTGGVGKAISIEDFYSGSVNYGSSDNIKTLTFLGTAASAPSR